jgi:hypothetical protein
VRPDPLEKDAEPQAALSPKLMWIKAQTSQARKLLIITRPFYNTAKFFTTTARLLLSK